MSYNGISRGCLFHAERAANSIRCADVAVAASAGVTLMPVLAVKPPIPETGNIALRSFAQPAPSRTIALVWRSSSPMGDFLRQLAPVLKVDSRKLLEP